MEVVGLEGLEEQQHLGKVVTVALVQALPTILAQVAAVAALVRQAVTLFQVQVATEVMVFLFLSQVLQFLTLAAVVQAQIAQLPVDLEVLAVVVMAQPLEMQEATELLTQAVVAVEVAVHRLRVVLAVQVSLLFLSQLLDTQA
jgi:hypothetical protein